MRQLRLWFTKWAVMDDYAWAAWFYGVMIIVIGAYLFSPAARDPNDIYFYPLEAFGVGPNVWGAVIMLWGNVILFGVRFKMMKIVYLAPFVMAVIAVFVAIADHTFYGRLAFIAIAIRCARVYMKQEAHRK